MKAYKHYGIKKCFIFGIKMRYLIITAGSLSWFLLSLIADMFVISAIVTPKWLVSQDPHSFTLPRILLNINREQQHEDIGSPPSLRYSSVGIYTRCKPMKNVGFHCGRFDLDGFATDSNIYPTFWKATMFFISMGFVLLTVTVTCTLVSCCRQSFFGKSIHNMTACAQVIAGICIMVSLFLHPLGWSSRRVHLLCGPDAEPFYPGGCSIGISFYCAVTSVLLCFISAVLSLKAESSNLRLRVKRCVEKGDRFICIP